MPDAADRTADRIAATQRGLITYRQARHRAGLTERQINWRVRTGRWRRERPHVFALAGARRSWKQSALAVQRQARSEDLVPTRHGPLRLDETDDAVIAGHAALWLRGCKRLGRPEQFHLLVARKRAPRLNGVRVRLTREMPPGDVEEIDGIPTLAVPRLLVELSAATGDDARSDATLTAVTDDLLATAAPDVRHEVHERAVALSCGRATVQRLIDLVRPGAEAAFRSWLEREGCRVLNERGVAPARWNVEVHADDGSALGLCDAVWVDARVVVELDGLRFHAAPGQYRRDRAKDRRLARHGWLVLRYTWLDIVERPDDVAAEVRAALAARRG